MQYPNLCFVYLHVNYLEIVHCKASHIPSLSASLSHSLALLPCRHSQSGFANLYIIGSSLQRCMVWNHLTVKDSDKFCSLPKDYFVSVFSSHLGEEEITRRLLKIMCCKKYFTIIFWQPNII